MMTEDFPEYILATTHRGTRSPVFESAYHYKDRLPGESHGMRRAMTRCRLLRRSQMDLLLPILDKIKYLFSQIASVSWFDICCCFKRQIKDIGKEKAR